jgi:Ca2+-binding RTX toxin-like protein
VPESFSGADGVTHNDLGDGTGSFNFNDDATLNGSFNYRVIDSGGNLSDAGGVTAQINRFATTITGTAAAEILLGLAGNDTLQGGDESDIYAFRATGDGVDTITDSSGAADRIIVGSFGDLGGVQQVLSFERSGDDLVIAYGNGAGNGITVFDHYSDTSGDSTPGNGAIETFTFHRGGASFLGYLIDGNPYTLNASRADPINGTGGNDIIADSDGVSTLNGGAGNDMLFANDGDDTLNGETGNDLLVGGADDDTYTFAASGDGNDLISDSAGTDSITFATGGGALASLGFTDIGDHVRIAVNDQLVTVWGQLNGTGVVENITFTGGASISGLALGAAAFNLVTDDSSPYTGGDGVNDIIAGSSAGETFDGNSGRDLMFGNGGADTYDWNATGDSGNTVATADIIFGFDADDILDVAGIDTSGAGGDQAFTFGGNDATVDNDEIAWYEDGGNTIVHMDTDGIAGAEMMFVLTGIGLGLTAADFNL